MTTKEVAVIPWTKEEDDCIRRVGTEYKNNSRTMQRKIFKKHFPETRHTDGAIEGRFSMVSPKYASKKWTPEICAKLKYLKSKGASHVAIASYLNDQYDLKVTVNAVASQWAAMACRGETPNPKQSGTEYVRQTKIDLTNTMKIPPENNSPDTENVPDPGERLEGRVKETARRMSSLTGEQIHLAHRLFDSLDKILG